LPTVQRNCQRKMSTTPLVILGRQRRKAKNLYTRIPHSFNMVPTGMPENKLRFLKIQERICVYKNTPRKLSKLPCDHKSTGRTTSFSISNLLQIYSSLKPQKSAQCASLWLFQTWSECLTFTCFVYFPQKLEN
jgi:hypothetical protein